MSDDLDRRDNAAGARLLTGNNGYTDDTVGPNELLPDAIRLKRQP